jgi:hypothetical protein
MQLIPKLFKPDNFIMYFGGAPKPAKQAGPVSSSSLEVVEAGRQEQKDFAKKRGFLSTLFAGSQTGAGKTTLGGGK